MLPRIHVKIVVLGRIKIKDGVEGNVRRMMIDPFVFNHANQCTRMTNETELNNATARIQRNETFFRDSLKATLFNSSRYDVTEFDVTTPMVQDTALDDDTLIRKMNLVRAPIPRTR